MRRTYHRQPPTGNRFLHCSFCHRAPTGSYVMVVNDRTAGPLPVKLCVEHRWILTQAGAKGRVHAPTGIRWWLADVRQQPAV